MVFILILAKSTVIEIQSVLSNVTHDRENQTYTVAAPKNLVNDRNNICDQRETHFRYRNIK